MNNMQYVQTQYGRIPISELPVVTPESPISVMQKCAIFYVIIIVLIVIVLYNITKPRAAVNKVHFASAPSIQTTAVADSFEVYNCNNRFKLDSIVLIEDNGNVINIDARDGFSKYAKFSHKNKGCMYSVDMKQLINIKEIILIPNEYTPIKYINVNLYKKGITIWEYRGYLTDSKEHTIHITECDILDKNLTYPRCINKQFNRSKIASGEHAPLIEMEDVPNKIRHITNSDILGIRLSEMADDYENY